MGLVMGLMLRPRPHGSPTRPPLTRSPGARPAPSPARPLEDGGREATNPPSPRPVLTGDHRCGERTAGPTPGTGAGGGGGQGCQGQRSGKPWFLPGGGGSDAFMGVKGRQATRTGTESVPDTELKSGPPAAGAASGWAVGGSDSDFPLKFLKSQWTKKIGESRQSENPPLAAGGASGGGRGLWLFLTGRGGQSAGLRPPSPGPLGRGLSRA